MLNQERLDTCETQRRSFFHGTDSPADVLSIAAQGFKTSTSDEEGRYKRDGILGVGAYISSDFRTALWYGNILLRVELKRGTRILDVTRPVDSKVIGSLKREFGAELLTQPDVLKVLPKNKRLSLGELVELLKYHYQQAWVRDWGKNAEDLPRWPRARERHVQGVNSCAKILRRYHIHGFGDPSGENGIVIFAGDRVVLKEVVASVALETWADKMWSKAGDDPWKCSVEQLRQMYGCTLDDLERGRPARGTS